MGWASEPDTPRGWAWLLQCEGSEVGRGGHRGDEEGAMQTRKPSSCLSCEAVRPDPAACCGEKRVSERGQERREEEKEVCGELVFELLKFLKLAVTAVPSCCGNSDHGESYLVYGPGMSPSCGGKQARFALHQRFGRMPQLLRVREPFRSDERA